MLISLGLVGPKARPKGVVDGQQVNIPVQDIFRPSKTGKTIFEIFIPLRWDEIWDYPIESGANSGVTRLDNQSALMNLRASCKL